MKWRFLLLIGSFIAVITVAPVVQAMNVPSEIEDAAIQMMNACPMGSQENLKDIVSVYRIANDDLLYVLDSSRTTCGDAGTPLCGTGGCTIRVYRTSGETIDLLYDEQVWSWIIAKNKSRITAKVHPGYCGGPGAAKYCEVVIDTATGKKRVKAGK